MEKAMLSTKFLVVFSLLLIFQDGGGAESWPSRRCRRQCTPQDCQVSSWYSWNSCSVSTCGRQGLQYRSRSVTSSASCGGGSCPELYESRQCYGSTIENCQLSSWSEWSACPAMRCDFTAIQTSTRHRITTEKCGGWCTSTFRKTRMCLRGSDNCKGYSGVCCEKSHQGQTQSGITWQISLEVILPPGAFIGLVIGLRAFYLKWKNGRVQEAPPKLAWPVESTNQCE